MGAIPKEITIKLNLDTAEFEKKLKEMREKVEELQSHTNNKTISSAKAIEIIKNNWPEKRYSMLIGALEKAIEVLEKESIIEMVNSLTIGNVPEMKG
ncbi:MAG TPA: hypothetical protein VIO64_10760 [Pseudobacteroides sp.]|uniref:hypothetical protein n=1 Tax=Pseudobacteroides sp. TaxID=1968840 RepID=UPI002F93CC07